MVGHIGHKVGERAIFLSHDAVFVVPIVGGLEPQRAVQLVGLAIGHQFGHGSVDPAAGVQAGLEVVLIKLQVEGLQVLVLLATQVRNSEIADGIQVVHITTGGETAVVGLYRGLGQKVVGNILDVVAVVESFAGRVVRVGRPAFVARLEALGPQLRTVGQRLNLHACVVVIKLAVDCVTLGCKQIANGIAQRCLAAVTHMQGACWIGRHKLHQYTMPPGWLATKLRPLPQHLAHHFLFGRRLQADVDKTGARDLDILHPLCIHRHGQQIGSQVFGQLAWIQFQGLGQLHGGGSGEITMSRHFGRLECRLGTGAG